MRYPAEALETRLMFEGEEREAWGLAEVLSPTYV